jgi:hypothetical protein
VSVLDPVITGIPVLEASLDSSFIKISLLASRGVETLCLHILGFHNHFSENEKKNTALDETHTTTLNEVSFDKHDFKRIAVVVHSRQSRLPICTRTHPRCVLRSGDLV